MVLTKDESNKQARLHSDGLKVKTPKCSLGWKGITYIWYIITQECIKPDTKKLQGIMDLGWATTATKEWAIIGGQVLPTNMAKYVTYIRISYIDGYRN